MSWGIITHYLVHILTTWRVREIWHGIYSWYLIYIYINNIHYWFLDIISNLKTNLRPLTWHFRWWIFGIFQLQNCLTWQVMEVSVYYLWMKAFLTGLESSGRHLTGASGTTQSQNGIFSSQEVTGALVYLTAGWISPASIPINIQCSQKKLRISISECQVAD